MLDANRKNYESHVEIVPDRPFQTVQSHTHAVMHACFSDDGTVIVSHDNHTIHIWKWATQQQYTPFSRIETDTTYVAASHDGQLIASICEDTVFGNKVRIWSLNGTQIADLSHHGNACNMIFTPDDTQLIVVDNLGRITLWDIATFSLLCESELPPGSIQTRFNNTVRKLAFAPDGMRLAVQWYTQNGAVQIYEIEATENDVDTSRSIQWRGSVAPSLLHAQSLVTGIAYSPDWQYLAVASDMECRVWLFDAFSLQSVGFFDLPKSLTGIADIAFSPEGSYLAIAGGNGMVWIWNVEHQQLLSTFHAHASALYGYKSVIGSINWSPNGTLIMTTGMGRYENVTSEENKSGYGENDYTLKLWKVHKPHEGIHGEMK